MSKLPLGQCPGCAHPLWDNDADFKGRDLARIHVVCIYCGTAMHYDLFAGKYVALDVDALPAAEQRLIHEMRLAQRVFGPDLMRDELQRRTREKKTS